MTVARRRCGCKLTDACTCPMGARNPEPDGGILSEALRLVQVDRAGQHGDFRQNCTDAAAICAAQGLDLEPQHIPMVLMALKLARMRQNPTALDNYVDLVGYTELLAEVRNVQVKSTAAR